MKIKLLTAAVAATIIAAEVSAHGYVSMPEGRSYACKTGLNVECGAVQWEPQSVEGPDGDPRFPIGGPADGTIAAAGSPAWAELNAQSPSRWYKHDFASGYQTFEWTFTANHVSRDWRYFITKADWNPAEMLTRGQFDLEPFCAYDGAMVRPPMVIQHNCYVPEREGYHVVLAVWDVGDTAASFYNMIDLNFAGENPVSPEPEVDPIAEVGLISGAIALNTGDTISTIIYDQYGELPELSVSYEATGSVSGSVASFELAKLINETGIYYAGQRNGEVISAVTGANTIYAKAPIVNVETRVEFAPEPEAEFAADVTGLPSLIEFEGMLDIPFIVSVTANATVSATLYDANQDVVIGDDWSLGGSADLKLHVHMPREETYTLVVVATEIDSNGVVQLSEAITLVDASVEPEVEVEVCEAVDSLAQAYPAFDASATYKGGELVSYNGLVYRAKWWTQGAAPDATDAFELVSDVVLPYSDTTVYNGGDQATFAGGLYEAKWWTRGNDPLTGPWIRIGDAPSC